MNRKFILFSAIFLGLAVISCNHTNQRQQDVNPVGAANAVAVLDSAVVKQIVNTSAQVYAKPEVPVLCYHRIAFDRKSDYEVTPVTFEAHVKILADSGYHSISPAQLYDYLVYNKALHEKPFMITFDDSRVEQFEIAAPTLEKYGFRGVFFIMTLLTTRRIT